jgi:hypothetical protein
MGVENRVEEEFSQKVKLTNGKAEERERSEGVSQPKMREEVF